MKSTLTVYAEHLPNIKFMNVNVDLSPNPSEQATATLDDTRRYFTIRCSDQETVLTLPVPASQNEPKQLQMQSSTSGNEVIFRLQAEDTQLLTQELFSFGVHTPWSAPALRLLECIHCSTCRSNLVRPLAIQTWKDLPSDTWAEMMEFWHCHKPDVGSLSSHAISSKGYSAASRLAAQAGTGFVDSYTFLLSPTDCVSVAVDKARHNESSPPNLVCTCCAGIVGFVDIKCSGWRLLKSSLAVGTRRLSVLLQSFPLEKWIAAFLLSSAEAQNLKRFRLYDHEKQESLALWIFTPDVRISYVDTNNATTTIRAMKLFWKAQPWIIADETVPADQSLDHLDLPGPQYYHALKLCLQENQSILPISGRSYQDWAVSILQRFDLDDVSGTE